MKTNVYTSFGVTAIFACLFLSAGCGSSDNPTNDIQNPDVVADVVSDAGNDVSNVPDTSVSQDNTVSDPGTTDTGVADTGGGQDTAVSDEGGEQDTGGTAGHPHDYWADVDWDTFFPDPSKSAVYHVTTFSQVEKDLTARLVENVEWMGGMWTQIVVGELTAGNDGMAIYFDRSEPWVIKAKGVVVYSEDVAEGPAMTEYFDEPVQIQLNKDVGIDQEISTDINGDYNGFTDTMGVNYSIGFEAFDAEVTVPAGTYQGCAHLKAVLGGELMGDGNTIDVEIMVHPKQTILKWVDSPGFLLAELKTEWE